MSKKQLCVLLGTLHSPGKTKTTRQNIILSILFLFFVITNNRSYSLQQRRMKNTNCACSASDTCNAKTKTKLKSHSKSYILCTFRQIQPNHNSFKSFQIPHHIGPYKIQIKKAKKKKFNNL